jgi:hypothetical protein
MIDERSLLSSRVIGCYQHVINIQWRSTELFKYVTRNFIII